MKLTGSVFPRIFGSDWIMSMSTLRELPSTAFIADEWRWLTNVVLSRSRYKESVCAPASGAVTDDARSANDSASILYRFFNSID